MNLRMLILATATLFYAACQPAQKPSSEQEPQTPTSAQTNKSFSAEGRTAVVYSTAKDTTLRLSKTGEFNFSAAEQPRETEVFITVNPEKSFQTLLGIGGAITDASAEVFAKLPANKQEEFLNAYFGEGSINYSLLRTNIHSCDFGSGSYTYIEEGDSTLASFSVAHDKEFRIPLLKKAFAKANNNIKLYASPWSPPAFMKSNKNMLKGGSLLPEFYQSWANYYIKFIQAYEAEGLPIWGLTVQNEPMAVQRWESCVYTAEQERDFVKNYLGPTLEKAGMADKKLTVWDHNRDLIHHRASTILNDPEAAKYVWGVGFHWYETWTGGLPMFDNLHQVKQDYPEVNLLFTEGCNEGFDASKYEYWPNAERYGRSMISDFNAGTVGWTDWNILLDQTGGPNHVSNLCFSPIHGDTNTGELIYTPSYYYIGHFSKFIHPGAKRISTTVSRSAILSTTFQNTDGKVATVIMNTSEKAIKYKLIVGSFSTEISIPARAMQTVVY